MVACNANNHKVAKSAITASGTDNDTYDDMDDDTADGMEDGTKYDMG